MIKDRKKIAVAMSGGVDSSVAVALLQKSGYNVMGVFMKLWKEPQCDSPAESRARETAKLLKIPFHVINLKKEFKKKIVDSFLKEYKAGKTPNPCVHCNKEIKFGLLLDKTRTLGADFLATGHYVRLGREIPNIKYKLLKGRDGEKDQSYFLWRLNQKQLKHVLFPVGDYTKTEVRKMAKELKLPTAETPESQEICFIHDPAVAGSRKLREKTEDFLKRYIKPRPGDIIDEKGEFLGRPACDALQAKRSNAGRHQGLCLYTIGQRKGIRLSGGPYFVIDKNIKKNLLIVSKNEKDLNRREIIVKNVNWISGKEPKLPLKIELKIRYRSKPVKAIISKFQVSNYRLQVDKSQRAVTPGQSAVFYLKNELLGGGTIE